MAKASKAPSDSPTIPTFEPSTVNGLTDTPMCLVDGVETDFIDCENGYLADGNGKTCHQACLDSAGSCCDDGSGGDACIGFTGGYHICGALHTLPLFHLYIISHILY